LPEAALNPGAGPIQLGSITSSILNIALDTSILNWGTSGDSDFFPQTDTFIWDGDAAQSGEIEDNQSSILKTRTTGPGTISFNWKVSSQSSQDYLAFKINGSEQERISGEVDWSQKIFQLPSGDHELSWIYAKNGSINSGADAGWVDQFVDKTLWSRAASMNTGHFAAASAAYKGEIFVFGKSEGAYSSVEKYTPSTDTWTELNSLPQLVSYNQAVTFGDKIYVILDDVYFYKYDPENDVWSQPITIPECFQPGGLATLNSKIYIFGCFDFPKKSLEYDPLSDSWKTLSPMINDGYAVATIYNGKIYVIVQNSKSKTLEVYDPIADSWELIAVLPSTQSSYWEIIETVGEKIYVIGDSDIVVYDPASNTWKNGPPLPLVRIFLTGEVLNNQIYIMGGDDIELNNKIVDIYHPENDELSD